MIRKLGANLSMFVLLGGIAGFVMSPNVLQEDDSRSIYGGNSCPYNSVDIATGKNCTTYYGAGCTGTVAIVTSTAVGSVMDVVTLPTGCVQATCPKDKATSTACQQNCGGGEGGGEGGGGGGREYGG